MPVNIGKIRALREAKGLSLAQAAAAGGLKSRQIWHHIEAGRGSNLTVATLEKIAHALGVSPCDLLTSEDNPATFDPDSIPY